jgi:hypothetical protein
MFYDTKSLIVVYKDSIHSILKERFYYWNLEIPSSWLGKDSLELREEYLISFNI